MQWLSKRNIFVFIFFLQLIGCKEEKVSLNHQAPEFATFNAKGDQIKLSDFKGKAILLKFWSAQCSACLRMMPTMERMSQTYHKDLTVVLVNIDQEQPDFQKLIKKYGLTFPVLHDQLEMTKERYEVVGTPSLFFIDQAGIVRDKHLGASSFEEIKVFTEKYLFDNSLRVINEQVFF